MPAAKEQDIKILVGQILEKQTSAQQSIKDLDAKVDKILEDRIPALREDLAMLKVRSGLWGAAAGTIPVIIQVVLQHLIS